MALHHDIAERLRNIAGLVGKHSPNAPTIEVNGDRVPAGIEQIAAETTLNTAADRLHAGRVSITVLGNVCRGKTTVLNALLGQELLPAGSQANTGGICKVEFGNNPDAVTLVMDDDSTRTTTRQEFEEFINLPQDVSVTEEPVLPDDLARLRYARLECDSPMLERGITLVDTLGFNAVNGRLQEETTRRFLNEASAVMLVLNTSPLVEQTDLDLLNACYYQTSKGTENVFIVINERIKGMSDAARDDLVENKAAAQLGLFFVDDNGEFDAARFRKRVFLVNPLADSNTGIPELEAALLRYVDEGTAMEVEVESAVRQVLLPALGQVDTSIQEQLAGYRLSHDEFATHQSDTLRKLSALRDGTTDLHEDVIRKGRQLADAAVRHFQAFFVQRFADKDSAWLEDWKEVTPKVREIVGLRGVWDIPKALSLVFSQRKREEVSIELQGTLQNLMQKQINAWAEAVGKAVKPEIDELSEILASRIGDFALEIDALEAVLSEHAAQGVDSAVTAPPGSKERILQSVAVALGVVTFDPNQIVGGLTNPSLGALLVRLVTDWVIVGVGAAVGFVLTGGGLLGALVAVLIIILEFMGVQWLDARWATERLGKRVGQQVLASLSADEMHAEIRAGIEKQSQQVAAELRKSMREEVIALEQEIARVASVRAADGSDKEIARLETISTLVEEEFGEISRLVFGHVLTPEERGELGRSVFGIKTDENAGESAV